MRSIQAFEQDLNEESMVWGSRGLSDGHLTLEGETGTDLLLIALD